MASIFETLMLICFGCSWPLNLAKSIRSKTAKGKSVMFQYAILLGYIFGICGTGSNQISSDNGKDGHGRRKHIPARFFFFVPHLVYISESMATAMETW